MLVKLFVGLLSDQNVKKFKILCILTDASKYQLNNSKYQLNFFGMSFLKLDITSFTYYILAFCAHALVIVLGWYSC